MKRVEIYSIAKTESAVEADFVEFHEKVAHTLPPDGGGWQKGDNDRFVRYAEPVTPITCIDGGTRYIAISPDLLHVLMVSAECAAGHKLRAAQDRIEKCHAQIGHQKLRIEELCSGLSHYRQRCDMREIAVKHASLRARIKYLFTGSLEGF